MSLNTIGRSVYIKGLKNPENPWKSLKTAEKSFKTLQLKAFQCSRGSFLPPRGSQNFGRVWGNGLFWCQYMISTLNQPQNMILLLPPTSLATWAQLRVFSAPQVGSKCWEGVGNGLSWCYYMISTLSQPKNLILAPSPNFPRNLSGPLLWLKYWKWTGWVGLGLG